MYVMSRSSEVEDIAMMFDEDFFNSAVIYTFPHVITNGFVVSYLTREDLVAREYYGEPSRLGYVLLSYGETCHKEGEDIVRDLKPLDIIDLKSQSDLTSRLSISVNENIMTNKSIASVGPDTQGGTKYVFNGRRFTAEVN